MTLLLLSSIIVGEVILTILDWSTNNKVSTNNVAVRKYSSQLHSSDYVVFLINISTITSSCYMNPFLTNIPECCNNELLTFQTDSRTKLTVDAVNIIIISLHNQIDCLLFITQPIVRWYHSTSVASSHLICGLFSRQHAMPSGWSHQWRRRTTFVQSLLRCSSDCDGGTRIETTIDTRPPATMPRYIQPGCKLQSMTTTTRWSRATHLDTWIMVATQASRSLSGTEATEGLTLGHRTTQWVYCLSQMDSFSGIILLAGNRRTAGGMSWVTLAYSIKWWAQHWHTSFTHKTPVSAADASLSTNLTFFSNE